MILEHQQALERAREKLAKVEARIDVRAIRAAWEPTTDADIASNRLEQLRFAVAVRLYQDVLVHVTSQEAAYIMLAFADEWGSE
jgi:hypothetical protein